jgi:gamma-glutamylcyclotransferase (GGCT)/AIG2-like uncharacterized protein YtfP
VAIRVFAYGSNLCLQRIRERAPSARVVGVATLTGHQLRFHKRGRDGSGKADAYCTGNGLDAVHGVVYTVTPRDKLVLDRLEGVGAGYRSCELEISIGAGNIERVAIYQADSRWIDARLKPFTWYRDYVLVGARQHGLNAAYVAAIAAIEADEDPDVERAASARAVLARAGGAHR